MANDNNNVTSIQIKKTTWRRLNNEKQGPTDTFDDVVTRLLNSPTDTNPDHTQSVTADWVSEHANWGVAEAAQTDARNAALADAYQRLRDNSTITSGDLKTLYDDHDISVAKSTWSREVLSVLATLPDVEAPSKGESTWTYNR